MTTPQTTDQTTIPDEHVYTVQYIRHAMTQDGLDWEQTKPTKAYVVAYALASGRAQCGSTLALKLRDWTHEAPELPALDPALYVPATLPVSGPSRPRTPKPRARRNPTPIPQTTSTDQTTPEETPLATQTEEAHTAHTIEEPQPVVVEQTTQGATPGPQTTDQTSKLALLPPLASLGLSAIMQVIIVTDLLGNALVDRYDTNHDDKGWFFLLAALFGLGIATALEGSAAYILDLYRRHLLAQDSTLSLRLLLVIYVSGSAVMIHWWADKRHLPWELATVLSGLAASSILLWIMGAKWTNRETMRRNGQLDRAMPRLSTAAKLWHPVRWIMTLWLTSWDPVQTTADARSRYAVWSADRKTRRADRKGQTKSA